MITDEFQMINSSRFLMFKKSLFESIILNRCIRLQIYKNKKGNLNYRFPFLIFKTMIFSFFPDSYYFWQNGHGRLPLLWADLFDK